MSKLIPCPNRWSDDGGWGRAESDVLSQYICMGVHT